mgnify:FL=1
MSEPLLTNYEKKKIFVTSYVGAMTSTQIQKTVPNTIDITNKKAVQRFLRLEVIKELLQTKYSVYFKGLTLIQVSRLLDLPKAAVPLETYKLISQQG